MKLFYFPNACSLAPHILLIELGLKYELERINVKDKTTLLKYNPKGYVPTLVLDNGQVLTEAAVVMQYLADQKPESNLLPKVGTFERYRCQEWLNYIATELHKGFSPLFKFRLQLGEEEQDLFRENLETKLAWVDEHFAKNKFFMGNQFTVADIYGFVVINWSKWVKIDLMKYKNLTGFIERVQARPATQAAIKEEEIKNA